MMTDRKEYNRKRELEHKEQRNAQHKKWIENNPWRKEELRQERYLKNKEKRKQYKKEYNEKNKDKLKEYRKEYYLSLWKEKTIQARAWYHKKLYEYCIEKFWDTEWNIKCCSCWQNINGMVNWHHVDWKDNNLSTLVNTWMVDKAIQEIEKHWCKPICANCHQIIHLKNAKLLALYEIYKDNLDKLNPILKNKIEDYLCKKPKTWETNDTISTLTE